jgi:hypothetical protein
LGKSAEGQLFCNPAKRLNAKFPSTLSDTVTEYYCPGLIDTSINVMESFPLASTDSHFAACESNSIPQQNILGSRHSHGTGTTDLLVRSVYSDHKIYGKHGKLQSSLDEDGSAVRIMQRSFHACELEGSEREREFVCEGSSFLGQETVDETDSDAVTVTGSLTADSHEDVDALMCRRLYNKMICMDRMEEDWSTC